VPSLLHLFLCRSRHRIAEVKMAYSDDSELDRRSETPSDRSSHSEACIYDVVWQRETVMGESWGYEGHRVVFEKMKPPSRSAVTAANLTVHFSVPSIFWYHLSWLVIAIRMLLPQVKVADDPKHTPRRLLIFGWYTTTQMLMYQPFVQSSWISSKGLRRLSLTRWL
jgi:hypothetical protein